MLTSCHIVGLMTGRAYSYLQFLLFFMFLGMLTGSVYCYLQCLLFVIFVGLLTGSVYNDADLQLNGFPGESVTDGSVIVVKTHEWGPRPRSQFSGAILLVRDPVDCILSEFNRQAGGGHTGHAGVDSFKKEGGKRWKEFLKPKLIKWEAMNTDWINNFEGPLLVISYTQLQNNLETQLKKILEFLEVTVETLELSCAVSRQEGVFMRPKRKLSGLLNKELVMLVNGSRKAVLDSINHKKSNSTINKL